jgi:shikimate kinase
MRSDAKEDAARDNSARRIVIVGFMGAGKTTVARALSRLLGCDWIDLDDQITRRTGRTPQQLIDEEGEPRFREIETRALEEVLREGSARVVALGGGAWAFEANRELVARHDCFSVWLEAPFDLCWRRIARPRENERPFARDRARARSLYDARRKLYALASHRVRVAGKSPAEIAAEIEKLTRPVQDVSQSNRTREQGGTKRR